MLSSLAKKDCYGYELVNIISKNIAIAEGTIYPLLRRLKKEGYVITYLEESQEGPPRKYYQLTDLGVKTRKTLSQEWFLFVNKVNELVEEGNKDEAK